MRPTVQFPVLQGERKSTNRLDTALLCVLYVPNQEFIVMFMVVTTFSSEV
jgi:hypothetical protein